MMKLMGKAGRSTIALAIAADTLAYDVFAAAGSPAGVVQVTLTVASGKVVAGFDAGLGVRHAAIRTTNSFAAGSTLKIVNNGTIVGLIGAGGLAGTAGNDGGDGGDGGAAIETYIDLTVDNTSGYIKAGGGGGGGGGGGTAAGGDGGNGAGADGFGVEQIAQIGQAGDGSTSGDGGGGGNVGDVGNAGNPGTGTIGGAGGAAGDAITRHGAAVTWLGGNNSTQVKGAVV